MEFLYRSAKHAQYWICYGLAVAFGGLLGWAFFYALLVLYRIIFWPFV